MEELLVCCLRANFIVFDEGKRSDKKDVMLVSSALFERPHVERFLHEKHQELYVNTRAVFGLDQSMSSAEGTRRTPFSSYRKFRQREKKRILVSVA